MKKITKPLKQMAYVLNDNSIKSTKQTTTPKANDIYFAGDEGGRVE